MNYSFFTGWRRSRHGRRRSPTPRTVASVAVTAAEPLEHRRLLAVSPVPPAADNALAGGCPICGAGGCSEHMGDNGAVYVKCLYQPSSTPQPLPAPPTAAVAPLADTFKLHSLPSATKKIYLDFDGHLTAGTFWRNGASFNTQAFSLDADYASFSDTDRRAIQEIWARVAEDFFPFDVDVTTEEPPLEDLRKSGAGDDRWGMRVVMGGKGEWMAGAAGVAYLDSFSWDSDTPCFVFADQSWKTNLNFAASCVSHEVGHTLGLRHDGFRGAEYYSGRGSGQTGWGPIMGNPGFVALTQWSRGEYGGSTNREDDLAIITTKNGFGFRPDDHGGTTSSATAAPAAAFEIAGFIGSSADIDMFRFTTSGEIRAQISPLSVGANLDILASLLDQTGKVIATSNPVDRIDASFTTTVSAGTYYLAVRGTGMGDINATGYTAYGSLGQYTVKVGAPSGPTPSLSVADVRVTEGNAGTASVEVTVTLSTAAQQAVTVAYATADGSATVADGDYVAATGSLTFGAGETRKSFILQVRGDTKAEQDETFLVRLSNPSGAVVGDGEATITVANDDSGSPGQPSLSVADIVVTEGNSGETKATFTVMLSSPVVQNVSFVYRLRAGSANPADRDYLDQNGGYSLNRGATSATIDVRIVGDRKNEPDETFTLEIWNATGATIGRGQAICTIINDDAPDPPPPPTAPALSVADVVIAEGASGVSYADFVISLSSAAPSPVTVRYTTADRQATAFDRDYLPAAGSVAFAPGETTKAVRVGIVGDARREANEIFAFVLSAATGAPIVRGAATGTILNDDDVGGTTVSVADARINEGNNGVSMISFVVSLSATANEAITVKFRTVAGTATAGTDFSLAAGEIRFARGGIRQTVNVWVRGDREIEENETFSLELFDAAGAALGRSTATGTIVNDDLLTIRPAIQAAASSGLATAAAGPAPKAAVRRPGLR